MKKIISILVGIISFTFLTNMAFGEDPDTSYIFSDVQIDGDVYSYPEAIQFLKDSEVINGYPDGSFKPYKAINRAEFLKIVQGANTEEGIDPEYGKQKCFNDVKANEWYTQYICYAKASGAVQGYSDGTFRPDEEVNLVEALKMTLKVFSYKYSKTEPWYKGVVDTASEINIIPLSVTGFDHKVTRGEMSDVITRIKKYETGELEEYLLSFIGFKTSIKTTYEVLATLQNKGKSDYCTAKPTTTEIGSLEYPVDPKYANIGSYLGQLLTAGDCADIQRTNYIFGVSLDTDKIYKFILGSSIKLKEEGPSDDFLEVLLDIGYECSEIDSTDDSTCSKWELTDEIDVNDILQIKPYVDEIKSGDCVNCG